MINTIWQNIKNIGCLLFKIESPHYTSEISYWKDVLPYDLKFIADPEYRRKAFPEKLLEFITPFLKNDNHPLRVLEIGSGPVSILAWGVDQNLFQLTAVDPLAEEYDGIMKKYNFHYPVKPIKGYGEQLLKLFKRESFDVVYSSNALDHVVSPGKSMRNICEVVKKCGIIFLEGFVNEGTKENWTGLHKHDLFPKDGQIFHCGQERKEVSLTSRLKLKCIYQEIKRFRERGLESFGYGYLSPIESPPSYFSDDWYTIVFKKI